MHSPPNGIRWWYESLDRMRRQRGYAMDSMGFGPTETPYRTLDKQAGMHLRYYGGDPHQPAALIIPAPIKRPYIWDLSPERSVVQHVLSRGLQVYLIEWTDPSGAGSTLGLEEYGYALIDRCIDLIAANAPATGHPIFLLGHSLGGVLSAVYAALRPRRVAGLVSIEAPLHFSDASGSFLPLLTSGPRAADITRWFDTVPGSVLNLASIIASPTSFNADRYADFVNSLDSQKDLKSHLQVQRWTLDETPMSRRLFEEVVEQLYREDRFMQSRLHINGTDIGPSDISCPFLAVYDPRSLIIPPESIIQFHNATASIEKRLLPYPGDTGVALAHVGALIGRNAHEKIWPAILDWINTLSAARH